MTFEPIGAASAPHFRLSLAPERLWSEAF